MRHGAVGLVLLSLVLVACPNQSVPRDDYANDPHARGRRGGRSSWAQEKREIAKYSRIARGHVPEGNIRVSYTYLDLAELQGSGFRLGGGYSDGEVGVRAGEADFHRNGLSVGVAGKHFGVRLSGGSGRVRSSNRLEQFTLVVDGGSASIMVGEVTPRGRVLYYGPGGVAYTVDLVRTGASMVVTPKIVDRQRQLIRVRITPDISFLKSDGGVELTRIQTDVVVRNGQTIVIGAMPTSRATVARSMFSYRAASHTRQRVVLLKVSY